MPGFGLRHSIFSGIILPEIGEKKEGPEFPCPHGSFPKPIRIRPRAKRRTRRWIYGPGCFRNLSRAKPEAGHHPIRGGERTAGNLFQPADYLSRGGGFMPQIV
jgi:hypothetical protein